MIRLRNILFHRDNSVAWLGRVCGAGLGMTVLQKEIDQVVKNDYKLRFQIPTRSALEKMRRINRDRTAQEKGRFAKRREVWKRSSNLFDRESFRRTLCRSFENYFVP